MTVIRLYEIRCDHPGCLNATVQHGPNRHLARLSAREVEDWSLIGGSDLCEEHNHA